MHQLIWVVSVMYPGVRAKEKLATWVPWDSRALHVKYFRGIGPLSINLTDLGDLESCIAVLCQF